MAQNFEFPMYIKLVSGFGVLGDDDTGSLGMAGLELTELLLPLLPRFWDQRNVTHYTGSTILLLLFLCFNKIKPFYD